MRGGRELTPFMVITGDVEFRERLAMFPKTVQRRVVRSTLQSGLTVVARRIRQSTPVKTGLLKKSVGTRIASTKGNITTAKVGLDVGSRRLNIVGQGGRFRAPHGHLVALGTGPRYTGQKTRSRRGIRYIVKTGGRRAYRGRMPQNLFVLQATRAAEQEAIEKMRATALGKFRDAWQNTHGRGGGRERAHIETV